MPTFGRLELLGLIEDYRQGLADSSRTSSCGFCHGVRQGRAALNRYPFPDWVPVVPSAAWVHQHVYLNPYPKELMLRSHV